jgi:menaquinone-dependent protoporphyrinogen IX oxidase
MLVIDQMTKRLLITCPETAHLEEIELEPTPLGVVIVGCSRYREGTPSCPRECARRMDRRAHLDVDDRERVLLVLAALDDAAAGIGRALAAQLGADGFTTELAALGATPVPPFADYDAVVIGACVRWGWHDRAVIGYIRELRRELEARPAFFYSVGGVDMRGVDAYTSRMTRRTGWVPTAGATFGSDAAAQGPAIQAFARRIGEAVPAALQPCMG